MTPTLTAVSAGLLAFCIVTEIGRELCFKAASDGAEGKPAYLAALALQPVLWLGIILWFVEMIAWLLVLEHTPLGLAFPIMTLTYAGVPLAGTLILKERLAPMQVAGAALVAVGVTCVGLTGL
ncbi:MAG: permease [Caulobacter sp. 12-67-6]|nr:MAG: permease [Caulobacter sp. 12-67-6]OYX73591.1 MAG: permease [Caulobacter sp. 32-67-35]OYX90777.1 MAG: permease [Caulobacter sp. 35-67-4]HQR89933.1 permease [Caulobacter sp.]